jgi:hypothetical protein
LQDEQLLEASGLEAPTIARVFSELKTAGKINQVPITADEGKEQLRELLNKKQ